MGGDTEHLILFSWFEVLWLSRRREGCVGGGGGDVKQQKVLFRAA